MKKYIHALMTDARQDRKDRAVQAVLWVFSKAYGFVVGLTRALYQDRLLPVYRAPKPVIGVGNITVGGVGKTPFVIWLVRMLRAQDLKCAVLSRGYKAAADGLNDEIRMLKEIFPRLPVGVGSDRRKSIQRLLAAKESVDLFIADDVFSHWPLHKDLDIVAIDAVNPFGNGQLIPRGILREQVDSLVRADVFLLTKTDQVKSLKLLYGELRRINSRALILESRHSPACYRDIFSGHKKDLHALKGCQAVAFCAIGDPSSFEASLVEVGVKPVKVFTFEDHHHYQAADITPMLAFAARENINILVTTHKDAVKIAPFKKLFDGFNVLSLDIELEVTKGQDEIIKRILSLRAN